MFDNLVFMSKMWFLLTLKNCSDESENAPDCIDFGLFFKKFPGGGGACPRMSCWLCRRFIDSSTRKNFPLFSQQSVTGYDAFQIAEYFSVQTAFECNLKTLKNVIYLLTPELL